VIRNTGCQCFLVGGVEDHIHLAIRLSRTLSVSKLMEEVKSASSSWIKDKGSRLNTFSWQRGYGVLSAGASQLDGLLAYINNQEVHHEAQSFQEEYRSLLIENGIEFDERYVWD
jgi:REP element-mobilizing transposase RayT